jgi:hypothetical protein
MKITKSGFAAAAAAILIAGVSLPSLARADSELPPDVELGTQFNFTINQCTSCAAGTMPGSAFVTTTFDPVANTTTFFFDVDLVSTAFFFASGNGTTFQFGISGPTLTSANISGLDPAIYTLTTTPNPVDALGTFLYGLNCTSPAGPGGTVPNNSCGQDLEFTATVSGNQHLVPETGGQHGSAMFAGDFCISSNGTGCNLGTGPFGAPVPGPIVGAGLPSLIFACGGLLGLARRRRRRQVA